jgi:hypothetical protein
MIRLNLFIKEIPSRVIVNLDRSHEATVLGFLSRVVEVCELDEVKADQLDIYDESFMLPHKLPSSCLKDGGVYTVCLRQHARENVGEVGGTVSSSATFKGKNPNSFKKGPLTNLKKLGSSS